MLDRWLCGSDGRVLSYHARGVGIDPHRELFIKKYTERPQKKTIAFQSFASGGFHRFYSSDLEALKWL